MIPYLHGTTHRLKKIASRYEVHVVFSAQDKLAKICPAVQRVVEKNATRKKGCGRRCGTKFVEYKKDVVYNIPLTCGKKYVGQNGRCLNVHLRKHQSSLKGSQYSHFAVHCRDCKCRPELGDTFIVDKHKKRLTREIIEAFELKK